MMTIVNASLLVNRVGTRFRFQVNHDVRLRRNFNVSSTYRTRGLTFANDKEDRGPSKQRVRTLTSVLGRWDFYYKDVQRSFSGTPINFPCQVNGNRDHSFLPVTRYTGRTLSRLWVNGSGLRVLFHVLSTTETLPRFPIRVFVSFFDVFNERFRDGTHVNYQYAKDSGNLFNVTRCKNVATTTVMIRRPQFYQCRNKWNSVVI